MSQPPALRVGFLGAGPVTQAIHLPTLARLEGLLEVVHVTDVDADVARSVAARVGARHSTAMEELLRDEDVDVVAVCSPHRFHAEQVIAACRAGVRGVLCEKPFATTAEEATQIAQVSAETCVPILVGAMHTFDPGWTDLAASWGQFGDEVHTIHSSIVLPPNARFEDFATEVINRPTFPAADLSDPAVAGGMVREAVMGLTTHDLPLIRTFIDGFTNLTVHSARLLEPWGYEIVLTVGGRTVRLHALMADSWRPEWVLQAWSTDAAARVEFSPSYVHAGSATGTFTRGGMQTTYGPAAYNGYEGEWRRLAGIVDGTAEPVPVQTLIDDLRFANLVADAASAVARESHRAGQAAGR
jgi:myo-inositol 2-dehydrogenase / D-chiro-inositol 1-dehydrogenase